MKGNFIIKIQLGILWILCEKDYVKKIIDQIKIIKRVKEKKDFDNSFWNALVELSTYRVGRTLIVPDQINYKEGWWNS